MITHNEPVVEQHVDTWLTQVVLGLNLCPFAHKPWRDGQVSIRVSAASTDDAALSDLLAEIERLDTTNAHELDTVLLVLPFMWPDFLDYNDFLDVAEQALEQLERADTYQLASFHPHYQFGGTAPDDAENLTNRAPYPILHLLRTDSVAEAIARHPDTLDIPEHNIERVTALSSEDVQRLFPWLIQCP